MVVILKENIDNLGRVGDVVNVRPGYARNFLIPNNLVIVADEGNLASLDHHKRSLQKKREAGVKTATELAQKLSEFSCTISRKVGDQDKLFGSVTSTDIAQVLNQAGFEVSKSSIRVETPIKTLGVHSVEVRLQPEVSATLKVWVVKEEG